MNRKMFDGSSTACIIFGFLVEFSCARFENTWSATRRYPEEFGCIYSLIVRDL